MTEQMFREAANQLGVDDRLVQFAINAKPATLPWENVTPERAADMIQSLLEIQPVVSIIFDRLPAEVVEKMLAGDFDGAKMMVRGNGPQQVH